MDWTNIGARMSGRHTAQEQSARASKQAEPKTAPLSVPCGIALLHSLLAVDVYGCAERHFRAVPKTEALK